MMEQSLKKRYNFYKSTGYYLSRSEILFYLSDSSIEYGPDLALFIKKSKQKLEETLKQEFDSVLEYEQIAQSAIEAKKESEKSKSELEAALDKANGAMKLSEKMRKEAEEAKEQLRRSKEEIEGELEREKQYAIQLQKGEKQGELAFHWIVAVLVLCVLPFVTVEIHLMIAGDISDKAYDLLTKLTDNHKDLMLLVLGFVGAIFTTYFGLNKFSEEAGGGRMPAVLTEFAKSAKRQSESVSKMK